MRPPLLAPRPRAALAAALLAAAVALPATRASGQTMRGTLRADAGAAPVEGALVALVDSAGDVAGGAVLSRADGGFRLTAPAPGRWRLRVRRIGFLPSEFGPYALGPGRDTTVALTVRWLPVPLAAARVVADARCRGRPASARTVALFDQARLALESERATRAEGLYGVEIERTDRILEDGVTAGDPVRRRMRGPTTNPFVTAAPESIAVRGYVADDTAGAVFHAPDAGVLLSDDFLRTHCLEDARGERGLVAVGVRSMRTLPGVGIQGTVWLDSATLALRRFEFRYENLPRLLRGRRATGQLEYRQLPGGRWLVERWTLRIPTPSVPFAGPAGLREGRYDREFVGRVLDVYAIDATRPETMRVQRPGATVLGTAIDSLRAVAPLAGATVRVEGTTRLVTTDQRGRFRLDSVPAGERTLVLDHPSLDSLGVGAVPRRLVLDDGDSVAVTLATPSAASVRAAACPGRTIDGRVLVGVVRDAATGEPLADVTVRAQWAAVGMGMGAGGRTSVAVRTPFVESYTGADGQYRLCDVDPDRTERVTVWATRGARATGALRLDAPRAPLEVLDLALAVDSADIVTRRTGTVVGRVFDVDGTPYANARLLVEGWDGVGRADESGRFRLDGVPAGTQAVRILRIGRPPLAHVLDVPPGREIVAEIRLRPAPSVLAPVVTRAEARAARVTEWVREVRPRSDVFLDSAAYHRARGAYLLDPVRARLTHPGVRLRDVPLPVLAAARGNCIPQVYADGLPVELADLRTLDPGMVETMAVFRQAAAAPPAEAPARRTIWVDTLTLTELPPKERPQSVIGTPIPRYGPDCGAVLLRTRRSFEGP